MNCPSRSRWRRDRRRRTSRSRGLWAEVITGSSRATRRGSRRGRRTRASRPARPRSAAPTRVRRSEACRPTRTRAALAPQRNGALAVRDSGPPRRRSRAPPSGTRRSARRPAAPRAPPVAARRSRRARASERSDRRAQALQPLALVGPDERLEQARAGVVGHVDRRTIDPGSPAHARMSREERRRNGTSFLAHERQRGRRLPPRARSILVRVAIPYQVEPGARAELDQVEDVRARALRDTEEAGEQHPRALNLVRLDGLASDELPQEIPVPLERRVQRRPRCLSVEHEVMETGEDAQRRLLRPLADERP